MRSFKILWILFGLLVGCAFPAKADFSFDKIMMKIDWTPGETVEKDIYCYSDWEIKDFKLDLTNKFSWPENNDNYSKFNVKAGLEKLKQLELALDYQWNQRYRIFTPEIAYDFKFKPGFTLGLEYENENRDPVYEKDLKYEYRMETGTVKMALDKKSWSYDLKLARTRKDYPEDQRENYTKNQLSHDLAWRIHADLKLNLSYYESTRFYPNDLSISKDYWGSKVGIEGEYSFNDRWQLINSFSVREEERGLAPYLEQNNWELKLKNKPSRDLSIDLRVRVAEYDFYSDTAYFDPDEKDVEEDLKSRIENKAALECYWRLKDLNLELEAGLFRISKDYHSSQVADFEKGGIYASLRWKPKKVGVELEIAPNGNLSRFSGFYQLKLEYYF